MTVEEDEIFCDLMRKSQQGHEESYKKLLTEASRHLEAYFTKRLFDSSMILDLVQETLISIHKSKHTFTQDAKFSPWFFAIAHNRFVDYIRKNKKMTVQLTDPHEDVEEWINDQQTVFDMEESLNHLSERERDILLLVKVEGLTIKETSLKLGLSEANIKVIIHRSIKKIKERLNRYQYEKD
jgi:RNA polymerase sigma-70 factor (ECF subfamily)